MQTPTYKKWYNGTQSTASAAPQPRNGHFYPGQILASGERIENQPPPTHAEAWNKDYAISIPYGTNAAGDPVPIMATVDIRYRVDDFGSVGLKNGNVYIELLETTEAKGSYGGHSVWEGFHQEIFASGTHTLALTYENIEMDDPYQNRKICELYWSASKLSEGGRPDPEPCACRCAEGNSMGGVSSLTRMATPGTLASSSAATSINYNMTADSMVWSCNMGALRGFGTSLQGKLQLCLNNIGEAHRSPADLLYNHPMAATLGIPEGGIAVGSVMHLRMGVRMIDLCYRENGTVVPVGVDTAGHGMATMVTDAAGTPLHLRWQNDSGAQWLFSAADGSLISYTGPELSTIENVNDYLQIKKSQDETSIQQIWSYWDGLLNVENITESGYSIALYTPAQIGALDATGYYTLNEGATPFKRFNISYIENGLTIAEITPDRPAYTCTWSQSADGAWSMTKGATAAEAVTTARVRTVLEPATAVSFEVWQLVTTISKGGIVASSLCEVYQNTPVGQLLLTRVEGYGSATEQTTYYEYDGVGNLKYRTAPNGHTTEHWHDAYGRVVKSFEPWRGGDYTLITDYTYAHSTAEHYSAEIATVTQKLRQIGTDNMVTVNTETHTYTVDNGIKREEIHRTAAGSPHTRLEITETWTNDAPTTLEKGQLRMTQGENGVQTWYTYTPTALHGAIYTVTTETRVNNAPVAGQSRRRVAYITAAGNTVREEEYLLLTTGNWVQIQGATHTYDIQNRRSGTVRDNGRSSSQELSCTGNTVWEIDENGIRTDYTYDSARQLTEISRAAVYNGETCITPETITEYTRDAAGRVLTVTRRIGAMTATETTAYDALGRVVSRTDSLGRTTTTNYSADSLTTTVTTPAGATLITTRNTDGSTAHVAGTGQRELHYHYDVNNSRIRETVRLADDVTLLSQTITDGFGQTLVTTAPTTLPNTYLYTRSTYNALGQLTQQTIDGQAPVVYAYDAMGNVCRQTVLLDAAAPEDATKNRILTRSITAVQEADGVYQVVMTARNNAAGVMLGSMEKTLISESATLESKTVSVDERGNTSTSWVEYGTGAARTQYSTIPGSALTAQTVSVDGFATTSVDHAGITTSATRRYTENGIEYTQTDGRGNTTTTVTDIAERTISTTDAAGNTTTTAYCACCDNPALITDPLGNTTCYRYDERGRKVAEWGTAVQPALFTYDDADRMTTLTTFRAGTETISTDPAERTEGDVTTWTYHDATGLETTKTYADGHGTAKTYDAYNRLATLTNARGTVQTNTYQPLTGLLTGMAFSDDTTPQSFAYNFLGQLTQVTDAAGTRTFAYNEYGEQTEDSVSVNGTAFPVAESRDSLGRSSGYSLKRNAADMQVVSYGYGTDGRISTAGFLHGGQQKTFGYSYLQGTNMLQTLSMPNNMSLTQSYEPQRDLLTQMDYRRGNTLVAQRTYAYDAAARPTTRSISRQGSTRHDTFTHNDRSELTAATLGADSYAYDYDNIGNRVAAVENSSGVASRTEYQSNNLNQYTAIDDFTPEYDLDGNQTRIKTSTGIWLATYNALNRPVRFESEDGTTVITADYDYMGRRVDKRVERNGSTTSHLHFLYRNYLQVAALDLTRPTLNAMWFITWDPTQPVATRPLAIQKDGTWYTYGWDLTKNICELYGQAGYVRTTYSYAPYGAVTATGDADQPIQWSSEYNDAELGMVYYNYRHYNPFDGRWIGRDFYYAQKLYLFALDSPVNIIDYIGLSPCNEPKYILYIEENGPLTLPSNHQIFSTALDDIKKSEEYYIINFLENLLMASSFVGYKLARNKVSRIVNIPEIRNQINTSLDAILFYDNTPQIAGYNIRTIPQHRNHVQYSYFSAKIYADYTTDPVMCGRSINLKCGNEFRIDNVFSPQHTQSKSILRLKDSGAPGSLGFHIDADFQYPFYNNAELIISASLTYDIEKEQYSHTFNISVKFIF